MIERADNPVPGSAGWEPSVYRILDREVNNGRS